MSQRPLRIAMISYYLPSTSKMGIGYQVDYLATELTRRGHTVDVFSPCPPVADAIYGHRQITLTGSLRTFRFATRLRREDFTDYDVLHAHGDDYWMWRRRVRSHVRTLHGSCFDEALTIKGVKEKTRMVALGGTEWLASLVADHTVTVAPEAQRWYPWVHQVIPNGVDFDLFPPPGDLHSRRETRPTVLFVGTWRGRKRGADVAAAFDQTIRGQIPDAQLWLVCDDAPEDLPVGVTAFGRIPNAQLADLYQRAWVFVLPSDYEGFGIPYAEAMAAGAAVVATPNEGARFVTDEGRFGRLAALSDISAPIVTLLSEHQSREDLSRSAHEWARRFSLTSVADEYERLYSAAPRGGR